MSLACFHQGTKKTVPPCMYGPGFPIGQGRTRWIRWCIKHRDKTNRRLNAGLRAARAHHMRGADPPPRRRHGPINGARGGGAPTHGHQPRARPRGVVPRLVFARTAAHQQTYPFIVIIQVQVLEGKKRDYYTLGGVGVGCVARTATGTHANGYRELTVVMDARAAGGTNTP